MYDYKMPIMSIKGIGPKKAQRLKKLGINTVEDLIWHIPVRYEDRRQITAIADALDSNHYCFKVVIRRKVVSKYPMRGRKILARVLADDGSKTINLVFLNNPYAANSLEIGESYYIYGKVNVSVGDVSIFHPEIINANTNPKGFGIVTHYPLTADVSNNELKKAMTQIAELILAYSPKVNIKLPPNREFDIGRALYHLHFPNELELLDQSRSSLIYYELFHMQIAIEFIKYRIQQKHKCRKYLKIERDELTKLFEWELTEGQWSAISEIHADMDSEFVMNRLVQGDVGSGKTAVAQCAAFKAIKSGYQVAVMAPTEILAKQHYASFVNVFGNLANVKLLSSSIKTKERKSILNALISGECDILIGTHALISDAVEFKELALVVTDEQHRFGVEQRRQLSQKSGDIDVMVMSATPIPRTLSLIFYADMSISEIRGFPKNRIPIETFYIAKNKYDDMLEFIEKRIQEGERAYFVAPTIEDSEKLKLKSVTQLYEELMARFPKHKIAMLHSKLSVEEKNSIMQDFAQGILNIIVATTVIEVGIDVKDATIMVITHSERFGLSQLHQLRGRVGRGSKKSYCFLLADKLGKISKKRIETMIKSRDGFEIAQMDLEIRGPGEFTGSRQHGALQFKIADIIRDGEIFKMVLSDLDANIENYFEIFDKSDFEVYLDWLNTRLIL